MQAPAVSIIIPTKDRSALLRPALDSLLAQSLRAWEAIIVDDGSADDTAAFVCSLAKSDSRFRFLHRARNPAGAPTCRNIGLDHAEAPAVLFLDSDDLLAPTCLAGRLAALEARPHADFIVANGEIFRQTPGDLNRFWSTFDSRNDLDRFLRGDSVWATPGVLWRRDKLRGINGWTEGLERWQDWELHIRAQCRQLRYHKLPLSDYYIRRSEEDGISASDHRPQGLAQRVITMAAAMKELRSSPVATPEREAILATLAFDTYVLLTKSSQARRLGVPAWKTFRRARGNHLADRLFTAIAPIVSRSAPESLLSQRLYRRWNRTPHAPANRLHCNATHIAFDGDASTALA
ncbi:MAG TPA: glycosyltransferase family A protein [Phycisphaerae bacterium]|nr:glycosyltransferase family A protein [Phycisphaerae bacterium]